MPAISRSTAAFRSRAASAATQLHAVEHRIEEDVVADKVVEHGAELQVLPPERLEGPVVLADVVPPQRPAEGEAGGSEGVDVDRPRADGRCGRARPSSQ